MGASKSKSIVDEGDTGHACKMPVSIINKGTQSICKIFYENNGKRCNGTGFFMNLNNSLKCIITNYHIIPKDLIVNNINIEIHNNNKFKIQLVNRQIKYFKNLDITIIEIKESDDIIKNVVFLDYDLNYLNGYNTYLNANIFILQYPYGKEIQFASGKIIEIVDKYKFKHNVDTDHGSSGSPIILTNIVRVVGIHRGSGWDENINYGSFIGEIFKDKNNFNDNNYLRNYNNKIEDKTVDKLNNNKINNINKDFENTINIIYEKTNIFEKDIDVIFGSKFVKNNRGNVKLIINGQENALVDKYYLDKGINNIQIIILYKITNLEEMFYDCKILKNIEGLKYLNTQKVKNFANMFQNCKSLTDIKPLQNWDVSKGINYSGMFMNCDSLSDISPLQNWNTSNGNDFSKMFENCKSLTDITPLQNWNVSNGNNFSRMFLNCTSLLDINSLRNWNVLNGTNFSLMFGYCESLFHIKSLKYWNVSNGNNFSGMFEKCKSLSVIKPLKYWNVSNGKNFSEMFEFCESLIDINPLQNWNVSNGTNFSGMFEYCQSITDINPLRNWNVSNGTNFRGMFYNCKSLKNVIILKNWNLSNEYFKKLCECPINAAFAAL